MSQLMRLWHLSPSVNSIFKHACAAIHWGSPEPSLFAYAISTIISWAGSQISIHFRDEMYSTQKSLNVFKVGDMYTTHCITSFSFNVFVGLDGVCQVLLYGHGSIYYFHWNNWQKQSIEQRVGDSSRVSVVQYRRKYQPLCVSLFSRVFLGMEQAYH